MAKNSTRHRIKNAVRKARAAQEQSLQYLAQADLEANGRHPLLEEFLPIFVQHISMCMDTLDTLDGKL